MKVLVVRADNAVGIKTIDGSLTSLQGEVGGLITTVELYQGCDAVLNDEGLINGMRPNFIATWFINNGCVRGPMQPLFYGDVFFCGTDLDGNFRDVPSLFENAVANTMQLDEVPPL